MGEPKSEARIGYADYLAFAETAEELYEFHDGEVYAMSGGSPAHAQLMHQLSGHVFNALRGQPCRGQGAAQRIRITKNHAVYPDLSIVCPPLEYAADDAQAIVNPTAVFEVLSPSTEAYDRKGKFELYIGVPSIQHVVLVSQERWRIEHYRRLGDGTWRYSAHGPGSAVDLDTLGVKLAIDEIYDGIEAFGGPSRDTGPTDIPATQEG
jgi:Uma2 family endonuclease